MDRADNQIPVACFAPPLTDEKLAEYQMLIDGLEPSPVKDVMDECMAAVKLWWELPESARKDGKQWKLLHRGKETSYDETPLEKEHVKALWAAVPWMYELTAMEAILDALPNDTKGKPLRDAAFHLLWFAKELTLDREPLTMDKLA